ncbi:hypothetical protein GUITHDRAFT_117806 [Guillardia theta CCMP2712]|uniref:Uncharacterized protein n=1 Tax=Guillardia theta (strain CCMP2712) TaxID=905079 RepID=L1IID4_GUITC|nr:hypothetical protein GUITHDRAFT_117806 [Guillardia theta CCMP2712]EKX36018.1 hypothetical protein GUITHDRAFT_117806 [Guillardia theta CCMP2712]|eukprot:XP_005822998.1 hypothetical protein GUITHDRAFT_117806 [Guillardia theta CCMP2712]
MFVLHASMSTCNLVFCVYLCFCPAPTIRILVGSHADSISFPALPVCSMKEGNTMEKDQGHAVHTTEHFINSITNSFASLQDIILCSNPTPHFQTADGRDVTRSEKPSPERQARVQSHFNSVFQDTERMYQAAVLAKDKKAFWMARTLIAQCRETASEANVDIEDVLRSFEHEIESAEYQHKVISRLLAVPKV